jgi:putative membrane protein
MDPAAIADISPRRQHPAVILLDAARGLSALIVPAILFLVSGDGGRQAWFLTVGGVWVLVSGLYQVIAWRRFTFEVRGGELRVHSGVLERQERTVPLERIQAMDIHETPLQRLLGVVGMRIETAAGGSAAADVKIEALTRTEAEQLRRRLGAIERAPRTPATGVTGGVATEAPETGMLADGQLIRRLSTRELLTAGVTSGTIGPALAVVGFFTQIIDDILPEEIYSRLAMDAATLSPRTLIPLIVAIGVLAWLLAIGGAVLTYGNFELRWAGDRVIISHGLLERRRRTVPVARMQAVVVKEGLLRRPFGLASVSFESAGFGQERGESGVLWPLLRRTEAMALVAEVAPRLATSIEPAELAGPPPRAFSRYLVADIVGWLVFSGVLLGMSWVLASGALFDRLTWLQWWWGGLPLLALPVVAINAVMRYRDAGWRIDPTRLLVISSGGLTRRLTVVPQRRLQFRSIERNPFQRRADLATFKVAIASGGAGGGAVVEHLDLTVAMNILDQLAPPASRPVAAAATAGWTANGTIET